MAKKKSSLPKLPTREQLEAKVRRTQAKYDKARQSSYDADEKLSQAEQELAAAVGELSDFDWQEDGGTPFSSALCPYCEGTGMYNG